MVQQGTQPSTPSTRFHLHADSQAAKRETHQCGEPSNTSIGVHTQESQSCTAIHTTEVHQSSKSGRVQLKLTLLCPAQCLCMALSTSMHLQIAYTDRLGERPIEGQKLRSSQSSFAETFFKLQVVVATLLLRADVVIGRMRNASKAASCKTARLLTLR